MIKKYELKNFAKDSDLKSRSLSLFNYLVDKSDQNMTCFPSIATIARELHISPATVKRAMKELIDKNYVIRKPRFLPDKKCGGQTSNYYTVQIPPNAEDEKPSEGVSGQTRKPIQAMAEIYQKYPNLLREDRR